MSKEIPIVCRVCGRAVSANEILDPKNWARISGGKPVPENSIILGYTMHLVDRASGQIAAECQNCWSPNNLPLVQAVTRSS